MSLQERRKACQKIPAKSDLGDLMHVQALEGLDLGTELISSASQTRPLHALQNICTVWRICLDGHVVFFLSEVEPNRRIMGA